MPLDLLSSQVTVNNRPVCRECKTGFLLRQYTESELNNQISYYRYMFDLEAHSEARKYFIVQQSMVKLKSMLISFNFSIRSTEIKVPPQVEAAYKILKDTIDQFLSQSAFCVIKLSKLFERLQPVPKVIPSN